METLRQCSILDPTASRLAELPYMTPEYIHAHVEAARKQGLRLGAAIARMELGEAPPSLEDEERARQADVEEKIRRFIEG